MRHGYDSNGERITRKRLPSQTQIAVPNRQREAGAEVSVDESTAQLLEQAAEVVDRLQRSEVKREQRRELDEFADRIADCVAERLANHGL